MTFATWTLAIALLAPNYPQEHIQWDRDYSQIETLQECQAMAKKHWTLFYARYSSLPGQLSTNCEARAHGKRWFSTIKCERSGLCDIRQGEY